MKSTLLPLLLAAGLVAAGAAQASPELAKSAGCAKCHEMDKTKKGAPGFKESAAKYKGKADAEMTMFKKVTDPKGDHPEMKASEADTKTMIKWILTQ